MNASLLIIVGLIGIAIGFALGLAVASLRPTSGAETGPSVPTVEARLNVSPAPAPPKSVTVENPTPLPDPVGGTGPAELPVAAPASQRSPVNPVSVLARALQSDVRTPAPAPKSIAAQIDEILQEMLENSPLESRAIRLLELPTKGMVVMVGLDQYEGVEAVPDEEIKAMIRSAVAEWERRISQ
jgi:hypothetical protein